MTNDIEMMNKKGLRITPQRLAVLDTVRELKSHPTAENVLDYIKSHHPNIATGTVYKTLDTFVKKGIIKKVNTEKNIQRFDSVLEKHHHLYCSSTDRIEDYFDDELDKLIERYFRNKKIPNFQISDINLQIIGKFDKHKNLITNYKLKKNSK